MGMIVESQILGATQTTNELLGQLLAEVRRTNELLEWVGKLYSSPAAASTLPGSPPSPG